MKKSKNTIRLKRHWRLRKNINGTAERPRLNVFRSLNNIYAQVIDDQNGVTLVSASSLDKEIKGQNVSGGNAEGAKLVGALVAKRAIEKAFRKIQGSPAVAFIHFSHQTAFFLITGRQQQHFIQSPAFPVKPDFRSRQSGKKHQGSILSETDTERSVLTIFYNSR